MDTYTLSVGEHFWSLDPDADIAQLQTRLTETVRSGGGIVDIPAMTPGISVLASPGLPIIFQIRPSAEHHLLEDDESASEYPNEFDWEYL